MDRPFDGTFNCMMVAVTVNLVEETGAIIGYTQSDEITLIFYGDDLESQIFFGGKPYKMTSVLAALASVKFNAMIKTTFPEKARWLPVFDCRVWIVPSKEEAVNVLVWREQDATRNSILMAGQCYYSHKQLDGKKTDMIQEMLHEKGVNWAEYHSAFKRGTYVQRRKVVRKFSCDEIERLPQKHAARKNPDLEIERTEVKVLEMPPILKVANRVGVVFGGEEPVCTE
jgi:tRNA(His) 5'-end guanylyltransferase